MQTKKKSDMIADEIELLQDAWEEMHPPSLHSLQDLWNKYCILKLHQALPICKCTAKIVKETQEIRRLIKRKSQWVLFSKKKKTESSIQDKQRNVLIKFSPKTDDVIVVIRERILISHGSRIKKLLLQFLKFFQILQPPIPSQVRSL
jgi:hypothetical protein